MSLSNEQFAMLERGRTDLNVRRKNARELLDLAYIHMTNLHGQQRKALKAMDVLLNQRSRSLCYRVPQMIAMAWARLKFIVRRGR